MVLKVKPKSFGPIFVIYDGTAQLGYASGEDAKAQPHPVDGSPVETMLASLGACIVRSVEWAASQNKTALQPFQVKVTAMKSAELPGQLETAEVTVIGNPAADADLGAKIVKQAKSYCTVSNSMNTEVTLSIQAD